MCRDVESTRRDLEARGDEFLEPIEDEGYGLLTRG
jgi:hypothetical protein